MAGGWRAGDYLDRPLRDLLDDVASGDPVPAAGSLIAVVGALAAGLAATVALRSTARLPDARVIAERLDRLRALLEPLITADAADYAKALGFSDRAERAAAIRAAAEGPVVVAEVVAEVAEIAAALAVAGNPNLHYDAAAAAQLAAAVAEVGAQLTEANVGEAEPFPRAQIAAQKARVAAHRARA